MSMGQTKTYFKYQYQCTKCVQIYCISHEGSTQHYAHFLFGCLIPLIIYNSKHPNVQIVLKINIGNMYKILKDLFGPCITCDYIPVPDDYTNDAHSYYGVYRELMSSLTITNTNDKNKVLLEAFDLYNDLFYKKLTSVEFNNKVYKRLHEQWKNGVLKNKHLYKCLKYKKANEYMKANWDTVMSFMKNKCTDVMDNYKNQIILIKRKVAKIDNTDLMKIAGGQRRIIYNFDELENKLYEKYKDDLRILVLEDMSIEEQFSAFYNAKIIIGQHGAGLANIAFNKGDAHVIAINPEWNNGNNWFKNLADDFDLNYYSVEQKGMNNHEWAEYLKSVGMTDDLNNKNLQLFRANSGSVNTNIVMNIVDNIMGVDTNV